MYYEWRHRCCFLFHLRSWYIIALSTILILKQFASLWTTSIGRWPIVLVVQSTRLMVLGFLAGSKNKSVFFFLHKCFTWLPIIQQAWSIPTDCGIWLKCAKIGHRRWSVRRVWCRHRGEWYAGVEWYADVFGSDLPFIDKAWFMFIECFRCEEFWKIQIIESNSNWLEELEWTNNFFFVIFYKFSPWTIWMNQRICWRAACNLYCKWIKFLMQAYVRCGNGITFRGIKSGQLCNSVLLCELWFILKRANVRCLCSIPIRRIIST